LRFTKKLCFEFTVKGREAVIRCNGKIGKRKNVKWTFMRMGSSLSKCSILDGRRATKCL